MSADFAPMTEEDHAKEYVQSEPDMDRHGPSVPLDSKEARKVFNACLRTWLDGEKKAGRIKIKKTCPTKWAVDIMEAAMGYEKPVTEVRFACAHSTSKACMTCHLTTNFALIAATWHC